MRQGWRRASRFLVAIANSFHSTSENKGAGSFLNGEVKRAVSFHASVATVRDPTGKQFWWSCWRVEAVAIKCTCQHHSSSRRLLQGQDGSAKWVQQSGSRQPEIMQEQQRLHRSWPQALCKQHHFAGLFLSLDNLSEWVQFLHDRHVITMCLLPAV